MSEKQIDGVENLNGHTVVIAPTRLGMSAGLSILNAKGGKPFVFDKGPSNNHCIESVSGNGMSVMSELLANEQLRQGGKPVVIDNGSSMDQLGEIQ